MKRIFLALMLAVAAWGGAQAQITAPAQEVHAETDARYMTGAIPMVDGKAVITRTIDVNPDYTPQRVMEIMDAWLTRCMNDERIRFSQRLEQSSELLIQHSICQELTFSKSFISHDFADLSYVISLDASQPGKVTMQMLRIAFKYNEGNKPTKYTGEELIADAVAINKKGKMVFGYKKFRMKTIDLADELATSLEKELK